MMKKIATRAAYGECLKALTEKNKNIVVLDADLSGSTKTGLVCKACPDQFFNVGIAEANLMGMAAGLATTGKIPFASTFAIFGAGRAYEIIRNSIGYTHLNVKIACSHAGLSVGEDGASHQAIEDISLMRNIPGMTVLVPADATETRQMVAAAVDIDGPVYLRLARLATDQIFDENYHFELGKAAQVTDGTDVTIIAIGMMVERSLEAVEMLKAEGISARLLNMGTIKPIDREAIILAAQETETIVTAEEHSVIGGLSSAVCDVLAETTPVPVEKVAVMDEFGTSGKGLEVLEHYHLTAKAIVEAAKKAISRK